MAEKKITFTKHIIDMRDQYKEYVENHIRNVQKACKEASFAFYKVFPNVCTSSLSEQLAQNLIHHDKSKFEDCEFWPYAARFFPVEGTDPSSQTIKDEFKLAWLHHVHNNPHHPGYWVLYENDEAEILDMPDIYIIEMLCDWMAMSKYYNSSTLDYWNSDSAQKLPMSPYTKSKVNEFMTEMDKFAKKNKDFRW